MNSQRTPLNRLRGLSVDVIVPLMDEERYLGPLLAQIQAQTYPIRQIFLVVAPSRDRTEAICEKAAEEDPRVVVLRNARRTAPNAMNLALAQSQADAWIRLDGHTEVPPELLSILVEELQTQDVDCVGPVLTTGWRTRRQRAIGLGWSSPFGVGNARFRTGIGGSGPVDTVAFGLYARKATASVGGFRSDLARSEDDEFNTRLRRAGSKIWMTDRVSVSYFPRDTFVALWRQRFSSGTWRVIGTVRHGNQVRPRQIAPLALVAGMASTVALRPVIGRLPMTAVFGAYGGLLVAQFVWAARRSNPLAGLGSCVATMTMHVSYGLGSALGLVKCVRPGWRRSCSSETEPAQGDTPVDQAGRAD